MQQSAIGIASRRGAGRVRYIDTSSLWLQQHVTSRGIEAQKVGGDDNPRDLGTKRLAGPRVHKLMQALGLMVKQGMSKLALRAGVAPMSDSPA